MTAALKFVCCSRRTTAWQQVGPRADRHCGQVLGSGHLTAADPRDRLLTVSDKVAAAMARLRAAERARRDAVEELVALGAVRSHVLVGDLGEQVAARYYGVDLAPPFTPGYDLVAPDGRLVQVKTLRATPTRNRSIIGEIKRPCDVVLAIRLDFDYTPTEALEIPIDVALSRVGKNGKLSWTRALAHHPGVRHIATAQLLV